MTGIVLAPLAPDGDLVIMSRIIALVPLLTALFSCAPTASVDIFQVGELQVRVYSTRQAMVQDLPESLQLVDNLRVTDNVIKVLGYFDREKNVIYSIDDARVVIHEFRHYMEPEWKHEPENRKNRRSKIED